MAAKDQLESVQKLYAAYYGRDADAEGLAFWAAQLNAVGGDVTKVVNDFANSAESQKLYGSLDNAGKVNTLYQNLLGRSADAGGAKFWTDALANGTATPATVVVEVMKAALGADKANIDNAAKAAVSKFDSTQLDTLITKYQGPPAGTGGASQGMTKNPADQYASVEKLYMAYYGREADSDGLAFWSTQLALLDGDVNKIVNDFANSAESQKLYGNLNDGAKVEKIYQNLLGRSSDPGGAKFWTDALANGTATAGTVMVEVMKAAQGADLSKMNQTAIDALGKLDTTALAAKVSDQIKVSIPAGLKPSVLGLPDAGSSALLPPGIPGSTAKIPDGVTIPSGFGGFGGAGGGIPSGGIPSGGAPSGGAPSGGAPSGGAPSGGAPSGGAPSGGPPSGGGSGPFFMLDPISLGYSDGSHADSTDAGVTVVGTVPMDFADLQV